MCDHESYMYMYVMYPMGLQEYMHQQHVWMYVCCICIYMYLYLIVCDMVPDGMKSSSTWPRPGLPSRTVSTAQFKSMPLLINLVLLYVHVHAAEVVDYLFF